MMYNYILLDQDEEHEPLTFLKEDDALAYMKAFPLKWKLVPARHITHINAQNYLDWNHVPKHLSFIYRDSEGVWASQYRPTTSKWYDNAKWFRMYGGERLKLPYQNYHELIQLGDVFENRNNNKHFINWKKVKGSKYIKFIDTADQIVEVFDKEGALLYSGPNEGIISKFHSMQFSLFPWQTYTYVRE